MKKLLIILITFLLLVCGFKTKSYSEIEQIAIASSLYLSTDENGFTLTVQIVDGYDKENKSVIASEKTLNRCLEKINNKLIKNLSLAHCAVTVIDIKIKENELKNALTFLKDLNKFPLNSSLVFTQSYSELYRNDVYYNLSEFLINKKADVPLYSVLRAASEDRTIKLPIVKREDFGYKIDGFSEKEVVI